MFGMHAVALAMAEEAEGSSAAIPVIIGVVVFIVLLVLLFVVTRFNPDR